MHVWRFSGKTLDSGPLPRLMGIVNVTPDSFSDGGQFLDLPAAVHHAQELLEQGADLLDVGGESTRPGAEPVSESDEIDRVLPVIEQLSQMTEVPISVDTMKADVAAAALQAGATIVNDVSALTFDSRMVDVCRQSDCGIIAMHMQGTPRNMQSDPTYDDVVAEVSSYLQTRLDSLAEQGIAPERVVLDPGIGFGKTAQHNLSLLSNIESLRASGRPILIGHSRKRFLGKLLGRPIEERVAGTIGVSVALAQQQADILRVHDVGSVKDALCAWRAVTGSVIKDV